MPRPHSLPVRKDVKSKSVLDQVDYKTLTTEAYYIGKSIILFTTFYCALNWWYYKSLRNPFDEDNTKNRKDNKD